MPRFESTLTQIVDQVALPRSAYTSAVERYKSFGAWLEREDSQLCDNDVHVFAQGSFALGTAIKPLNGDESYDLDLACKLREGVSTSTHSQQQVKAMLRHELERYRIEKGIKDDLEEMHRCWRLLYQGAPSFHMDIVPCIPADEGQRNVLVASMESLGTELAVAKNLASTAVLITDDRSASYDKVSNDWLVSNPEGYAEWFVSRSQNLNTVFSAEAYVEEVPYFGQPTNLQRAIQVLKRHRDVMFQKAPDHKPISVIITTIAANAYQPSDSLGQTMTLITQGLQNFVERGHDRLPNPVDPKENFADRWCFDRYAHLQLKENFHRWVSQVARDIEFLKSAESEGDIRALVQLRFALGLSEPLAQDGNEVAGVPLAAVPQTFVSAPPRPWGAGR